jgi:hypothetical protein
MRQLMRDSIPITGLSTLRWTLTRQPSRSFAPVHPPHQLTEPLNSTLILWRPADLSLDRTGLLFLSEYENCFSSQLLFLNLLKSFTSGSITSVRHKCNVILQLHTRIPFQRRILTSLL